MSRIKNIGYLLSFPEFSTNDFNLYIDCAISLLENNIESQAVKILAGLILPINFFEIKELILKVKEEVKIKPYTRSESVIAFSYQIVEDISNDINFDSNLFKLTDFCESNDFLKEIYDFYLLYYALDDLKYGENQHIWEGMNRNNCLDIIINYSKDWLDK